jgi:hypothetical protein
MTARKPADDKATDPIADAKSTEDAIAAARDGDPSPDAITDAEASKIARTAPTNSTTNGSSFPGSDGRSFAVPLPLEPGEGIIGSTSDTGREDADGNALGGVNVYVTNLGRRLVIDTEGALTVESVEDDVDHGED